MEPVLILDEGEEDCENLRSRRFLLNRLPLSTTLRICMTPLATTEMAAQRRVDYELTGLSQVPRVETRVHPPRTNSNVAKLLELCRLRPELPGDTKSKPERRPTEKDEPAILFDLLATALRHNRYDVYMQVSWGRWRDEPGESQEWGVDPRPATLNSFASAYADRFRQAMARILARKPPGPWARLQSLSALRVAIDEMFAASRADTRLLVDGWAPYVARHWPHSAQAQAASASRFIVHCVDPDDEKIDWWSLFRAYRRANPLPAKHVAGVTLNTRPHEEDVLDPCNLTLAAIDRLTGTMAGYVTCALGAAPEEYTAAKASPALKEIPALGAFYNWLVTQAAQSDASTCGFDVLVINGLHVAHAQRGTGLGKLLFYFLMRFISAGRAALGLRLVTSEADAVQTKAWLCNSFAFTHHNPYSALNWLVMALLDYVRRRSQKDRERVDAGFGTVDSQLMLGPLARQLGRFATAYPFANGTRDGNKNALRDTLADMAREYELRTQEPDFREQALRVRDGLCDGDGAPFPRPRWREVKKQLRRQAEALRDHYLAQKSPLANRQEVIGAGVKALLGTDDQEDTFLDLGNETQVAAFEAQLELFERYYREADPLLIPTTGRMENLGAPEEEDQRFTGHSQSQMAPVEDMELSEPSIEAVINPNDQPTERDMLLYVLWEESETGRAELKRPREDLGAELVRVERENAQLRRELAELKKARYKEIYSATSSERVSHTGVWNARRALLS